MAKKNALCVWEILPINLPRPTCSGEWIKGKSRRREKHLKEKEKLLGLGLGFTNLLSSDLPTSRLLQVNQEFKFSLLDFGFYRLSGLIYLIPRPNSTLNFDGSVLLLIIPLLILGTQCKSEILCLK